MDNGKCPTCGEDRHGFLHTPDFISKDEKQTITNREDKLDAIFRMQKIFADQLKSEGKFPYKEELAVKELCIAMSHEVHELQNTTSWKWWKKPKYFDTKAAREELVDIFHFAIHCALELEMTAEDLLDVYTMKMSINKQRQENGY